MDSPGLLTMNSMRQLHRSRPRPLAADAGSSDDDNSTDQRCTEMKFDGIPYTPTAMPPGALSPMTPDAMTPGGMSTSTVLSRPYLYGERSMLASSPARPLRTNCSDAAVVQPASDMAGFLSEGTAIKAKVEELEDAFSLLQTCATTAFAKQEAQKNHAEETHATQSEVTERYWRDEVRALETRHRLELEMRSSAERGRAEADRLLIVDKYKHKLESFKNQVQEAEKAYRDKYVQILGSLDESRRELAAEKQIQRLREEELVKEMAVKDAQIAGLRTQLEKLAKEREQKVKWRSVAIEMASNVVELSCDAAFLEPPPRGPPGDRAIVSKAFLADLVVNSKVIVAF